MLIDFMRERLGYVLFLAGAVLLAGCGSGSDRVVATYAVTVTNAGANQPLSPPVVVIHREGYDGWTAGVSASTGLEKLAEGGDAADFIAEANLNGNVETAKIGSGVVAPGGSTIIQLSAPYSSDVRFTVASMLVNTNDAFTGVNGVVIAGLGINEAATFYARVYDAGTEINLETAATVPGPAGGGEGFNAARNDYGFVSIHGGMVTGDDGLTTSALNETHRFVGPVAKITVVRVS